MGDREAFRMFFDLCHADLLRTLIRRGLENASAEDVVQQAFMRIWETRSEIDVEKPLRGLLFRIGITRSLNALRDASRRPSADMYVLGQAPTPDSGDASVHADLRAALARAVQTLPERRRQVFELCFSDGLTHREAAEVLGISPKTVEHQMGHALKSIRASLAPFA